MIGGSNTRKNMVGENDSTFLISSVGSSFIISPTNAPKNTIARLSGM